MPWIYLTLAILTEVVGTVALRSTNGFTNPLPSAVVVVGYALSFLFMSLTLKGLSMSTTYAVWAGVGTAAIAFVGVAAHGEPVTAVKLGSLALIIAGVVGLNLTGTH